MKIWQEDFDQEDLDVDLDSDLTGVPVTTGTSLKGLLQKPLKVRLGYRRLRPAAFAVGPIIVVDEKVQEALQSAKTAIEFYPVEVTDRKTREVVPYFFMNVLSELDCLDRTHSEYEDFKGYAQNIAVLRLKRDCASLDLFRLAWTLPPLLVVADDLARRLTAIGRLGLKFVDAESYRDPALV
ncbi:MAG: imm11 family protein [Thermoanaerobaculia bacterium]